MNSLQNILHLFKTNSKSDDICLIYDDGEEILNPTKISYKQAYFISEEVHSNLLKCGRKKIIGIYFNINNEAILSIFPVIIAILKSNCAFVVLDNHAQPWHVIEDIILNLNISLVVTDDGSRAGCEADL